MSDEQNYGAKIAAAFVKAQAAFGKALKSKDNPFFKSHYADLSSCVNAVSEALHANGIAFVQRTSECSDGVKVVTVLIHESGETISSGWLHVPAVKNDPQAYGSALTYARRYSLMTICGIAPEDDDGNSASAASKQAKPKAQAPPAAQPQSTPPPCDAPSLGGWLVRMKAATSTENCRTIWKDAKADGITKAGLDALAAAAKEWEANNPVIDVGF